MTPMDRQKFMLDLLLGICAREFTFEDFEQCRTYFQDMINILRQMNYSKFKSEEFEKYHAELNKLLSENGE